MEKIVFIHHATSSVGAGLSALHILSNIPKDMYEVVVLMPKCDGDLKEKINALGIRVRDELVDSCSYIHVSGYHYNLLSISHFNNILSLMKSSKKMEELLTEEMPSFIFANSLTLFWVGRLGHRLGAKTVCFDRETYYKGLFGLRTMYMKRRLNADFDRIVFLSEYDMKQTGKDFKKYVKITDKVDTALYVGLSKKQMRRELNIPEDKKVILYTGGMSFLKGVKILLDMMRRLPSNYILVFLGYFSQNDASNGMRKFRQLIRRKMGKDEPYWIDNYINCNNLHDKLILRENTDQVEKYFAACDAVVFASQEPHQARPIFEAGVAKRPVIVSDFDNTREFLDEKSGWLVKHNDVDAWENACLKVIGNCDLARVDLNYKLSVKNNNINTLENEISWLLREMAN